MIPRSITLPRYYEVILLINPLKLSRPDEYRTSVTRKDNFLDVMQYLEEHV
jgi:hypothetical protein